MQSNYRAALAVVAVAAALTACGGGGGDDDGGNQAGGGAGGGTGNVGGTDLPGSATQDVGGLVAYVKGLINTMTDNTSEPVRLGDAVLPTSDTTEPISVN